MVSDSEKLEFIQRTRSGDYVSPPAKAAVRVEVAEASEVPLSRLDMLAEELIELIVEKLRKQ